MIAPSQIVGSIDNQKHRVLIDRLLSNGRCHSAVAQRVLRQPESLMPSAIGLGLQRIGELAYWALPEGVDLAHRLLRLQRRDGLYGSNSAEIDHLIGPTAIAVRALVDWLSHFNHDEAERALLQQSVERACLALCVAFERESHDVRDAREQHETEDARWAIVLWQLGDCEAACARLPMHEIHDRIKTSSPAFRADDLSRLALTMAA